MLEIIRNSVASKAARFLLLATAATSVASCASKPEPQIVSTGAGRESALPWNKQETWENNGQFGALGDQMAAGGSRR